MSLYLHVFIFQIRQIVSFEQRLILELVLMLRPFGPEMFLYCRCHFSWLKIVVARFDVVIFFQPLHLESVPVLLIEFLHGLQLVRKVCFGQLAPDRFRPSDIAPSQP